MFSDLNGNGQVTETEIIQAEHYYPFGMTMQGHGNIILSENDYKYNGKELNTDFGLDLYDYGARYYDAAIGRWHGVDPLAEAFIVHSPYNYGVNNPIMMVDPDGRAAVSTEQIVANAWNAVGNGQKVHFTMPENGFGETQNDSDSEDGEDAGSSNSDGRSSSSESDVPAMDNSLSDGKTELSTNYRSETQKIIRNEVDVVLYLIIEKKLDYFAFRNGEFYREYRTFEIERIKIVLPFRFGQHGDEEYNSIYWGYSPATEKEYSSLPLDIAFIHSTSDGIPFGDSDSRRREFAFWIGINRSWNASGGISFYGEGGVSRDFFGKASSNYAYSITYNPHSGKRRGFKFPFNDLTTDAGYYHSLYRRDRYQVRVDDSELRKFLRYGF
jgi:RHS repeat-associated protein